MNANKRRSALIAPSAGNDKLFPRSSNLTRRVVITGLGLVTPVGNTVEDTWTALMSGRSGADYIKKFDAERFSVKFACEVKNFDPLTFIAKKEARKMGAFIHYAIAASIEAVADSGIQTDAGGQVSGRLRRECRHIHQQRHRRLLGHRARTLEVARRWTRSRLAVLYRLCDREPCRGPGLDSLRRQGTKLSHRYCLLPQAHTRLATASRSFNAAMQT